MPQYKNLMFSLLIYRKWGGKKTFSPTQNDNGHNKKGTQTYIERENRKIANINLRRSNIRGILNQ